MLKKLLTLVLILVTCLCHAQTKGTLSIYADKATNKMLVDQQLTLSTSGISKTELAVKTFIYSKKTAVDFKAKDIKPGFLIILTGKDGKEKYRANKPVYERRLVALLNTKY